MQPSSEARPLAPELPLRFIAGDPALDMVNTVDWTDQGLVFDRLTDYGRVVRWAEGAHILTPSAALRLRRAAAAYPRQAERALDLARRLRLALQQCVAALASGSPADEALGSLNRFLPGALRHLRLAAGARGSPRFQVNWAGRGESLDSPLWPVLWSAIQLLTSDDAGRIRVCGGENCGWVYVDRSRNGLRRWCQMGTCGTAAKNRRRSVRKHADAS